MLREIYWLFGIAILSLLGLLALLLAAGVVTVSALLEAMP